jgi:O-acetyl-ADP-ribose deacetylase (regulator of RNase III)
MNIYLLSNDKNMTDAWNEAFPRNINTDEVSVEIVCDSFSNFMHTHSNIDCVVSPGNSYGIMDGGYDAAIINYFGEELMKCVQEKIHEEWLNEQVVGTSIIVKIPNWHVKKEEHDVEEPMYLIHTPTMRVPEEIKDKSVVYQCMRSTLIMAKKENIQNIVIPAFGAATGRVPYFTVANLMCQAFINVFLMNLDKYNDWNWADYVTAILKLCIGEE